MRPHSTESDQALLEPGCLCEADEYGYPVEQELRAYLECGIPACGFVRVRCADLGVDWVSSAAAHDSGGTAQYPSPLWRRNHRDIQVSSPVSETPDGGPARRTPERRRRVSHLHLQAPPD